MINKTKGWETFYEFWPFIHATTMFKGTLHSFALSFVSLETQSYF